MKRKGSRLACVTVGLVMDDRSLQHSLHTRFMPVDSLMIGRVLSFFCLMSAIVDTSKPPSMTCREIVVFNSLSQAPRPLTSEVLLLSPILLHVLLFIFIKVASTASL